MSETLPLPLQQAQRERRCRICGGSINLSGAALGVEERFGRQVYPMRVTFDYGDEFAHTECLPPSEDTVNR